jgi:hypothetical protein
MGYDELPQHLQTIPRNRFAQRRPSTFDELLEEAEELVESIEPRRVVLALHLFPLILTLAVAILCVLFSPALLLDGALWLAGPAVLIACGIIPNLLSRLRGIPGTTYALTTRAILARARDEGHMFGFFVEQALLRRVDSVEVEEGLLGRVTKTGTIVVDYRAPNGERGKLRLRAVPRPFGVATRLRAAIEEAQARPIESGGYRVATGAPARANP